MKKIILPIIITALGVVTFIGLQTFAGPCRALTDAGMFMRCHDTALTLSGISVVITIIGILMVIFRRLQAFVAGLNIPVILLGVLLILTPTLLTDTCGNQEMICNTGIFVPFNAVMGGVILIVSIINAFLLNKKEK